MRIASACKSFADGPHVGGSREGGAQGNPRTEKQERKETLQQRVDALKAKFRKQ
jgi:hypothetical protein